MAAAIKSEIRRIFDGMSMKKPKQVEFVVESLLKKAEEISKWIDNRKQIFDEIKKIEETLGRLRFFAIRNYELGKTLLRIRFFKLAQARLIIGVIARAFPEIPGLYVLLGRIRATLCQLAVGAKCEHYCREHKIFDHPEGRTVLPWPELMQRDESAESHDDDGEDDDGSQVRIIDRTYMEALCNGDVC